MSYIKVDYRKLEQTKGKISSSAKRIDSVVTTVENVKSGLDWDVACKENINRRLINTIRKLNESRTELNKMADFVSDAATEYKKVESVNSGKDLMKNGSGSGSSKWDVFASEFQKNYGMDDFLKGAGYIGTVYNFVKDIKNAKSWVDMFKTSREVYNFTEKAVKTYKNYMKIGRAVGKTKATVWWAKAITGLKPLGRASVAKKPWTRFVNNLTNKTSPFNAQFKNVVNNFKGANGVAKAAAAWAGVAVNGVINWNSNKEEQEASNGKMSDGRVLAETITETAVDTVLTYGSSIVIGAAVTTALGTVAAPGILVVALTGAVSTGINAGVKALTGKSTTEWISDTILDTGENIIKGARKASKSIGRWYQKLLYA